MTGERELLMVMTQLARRVDIDHPEWRKDYIALRVKAVELESSTQSLDDKKRAQMLGMINFIYNKMGMSPITPDVDLMDAFRDLIRVYNARRLN